MIVLSALTLIAFSGALVIRETTRFGSGLRDDSFVYMSSAEGIATLRGYARQTGEGSMRPTIGFPPGYSFSLAVLKWTGIDLHAGTRLLGGLGFSSMVLLVGVGVGVATGSAGLALLTAVLVLSSPTLIDVHSWALSESVYLPLSLAGILLTTGYLESGDAKLLVLGGLAVGMSTLTRYAGLSLALALLGCIALRYGSAERRGRLMVAAFAALSLGPIAAFLARNVLVSGGLANRPGLNWQAPEAALIKRTEGIVASWLVPIPDLQLPDWLNLALASLLLLGLAIGTVRGLRAVTSWRREPGSRLLPWIISALGVHALIYLAVLFAAMSVADPNIQVGFSAVGERLLAPLHLDLLLLIPLSLYAGWQRIGSPRRLLVLGAGLIFSVAQVFGGAEKVADLRKDGRGFNSIAWRSSPTMAYIRELSELPIYTNNVAAVYLLGGRYSSFIPEQYNISTRSARPDYPNDLDRMHQRIREEWGILAILGGSPRGRLEPEYLAELSNGLTLVEEFSDGLIYRYTGDR